jgi:hypothetical protein
MDTAQQNVVNQATIGAASVPQLQNTAAQGAINQIGAASNPFTQAQTSLGQIASGAANPWITDPTTGAVTPNTNTAMGGLFQAQNQQLAQLAPNIMAPVTAGGTAQGQFGSLRTQTAADKALADAQAQLFTTQNQAALTNQQTGVQAGSAMGNVANQYGTTATGLANLQQSAPMAAASNLGKTISGLNVPTTVTGTTQVSPLNQIIAAGSALQGGTTGLNALLNQISPGASISSLLGNLTGRGSGMTQTASGGVTPGSYNLADGSTINVDGMGNKTITARDGTVQYFDQYGNPTNSSFATQSAQDLQNQNIIPDTSGTSLSSGAGDTSSIDNFDYSTLTG